jgi:hypothetical protein
MRTDHIFILTLGLTQFSFGAHFDCLHGWPSASRRYRSPPSWTPGQPIPPGWRWGDPIPYPGGNSRTPYPPLRARDDTSLSAAADEASIETEVDLDTFKVDGPNLTETNFEMIIGADNANNAAQAHWDREGDCCMVTWDCMMMAQFGPWSLAWPPKHESTKTSWCCIVNYQRTCKSPQKHPPFTINYPPACS